MRRRSTWAAAFVSIVVMAGCAASVEEPEGWSDQALSDDSGEGWGADAELCSFAADDEEDAGEEDAGAADAGADTEAGSGSGRDAGSGSGSGSGAGSGSGSGRAYEGVPALRESNLASAEPAGITPQDRPRPPRPRRCRCAAPNVPAASRAACPRPRDVDRTDRVRCTKVDAGGNWAPSPNPSHERWQCGPSSPHYPCWPSASNGGDATHTHHDRVEFNFGNGCCFYKVTKDVEPVTCR